MPHLAFELLKLNYLLLALWNSMRQWLVNKNPLHFIKLCPVLQLSMNGVSACHSTSRSNQLKCTVLCSPKILPDLPLSSWGFLLTKPKSSTRRAVWVALLFAVGFLRVLIHPKLLLCGSKAPKLPVAVRLLRALVVLRVSWVWFTKMVSMAPSTNLSTSKPLGLHSILADSPLRTSHWYPLPLGPLMASHPAQIVSKFVRCFKPGVGLLSLLTSFAPPGLFVLTVRLLLLGVTPVVVLCWFVPWLRIRLPCLSWPPLPPVLLWCRLLYPLLFQLSRLTFPLPCRKRSAKRWPKTMLLLPRSCPLSKSKSLTWKQNGPSNKTVWQKTLRKLVLVKRPLPCKCKSFAKTWLSWISMLP